MKDWFISKDEEVTGPYSTEEVQNQINMGSINGHYFIWNRSQGDWKTVASWISDLPNMNKKQVTEETEELWHYAVADTSYGPMPRSQLVSELKDSPDKKGVLVWTKGMKSWTSIYEFHEMLDEIGVNRRQFPRASISGSAIIHVDDQTYIGQLATISEGGLGAQGLPQLTSGQNVQVEIKSQFFASTISSKATVQYVSQKGFAGLKFENMHMEAKSTIIEYVKGYGLSSAA